jgi:hypothetical protein
MIISSCLIALMLTIIIELSVAYLFGFKDINSLSSIICVNTITHPVFCYFLWISTTLFLISINYYFIIVLEIIITFIEAAILYITLKQKFTTLLKLSVIMNFASFAIGLIIF